MRNALGPTPVSRFACEPVCEPTWPEYTGSQANRLTEARWWRGVSCESCLLIEILDDDVDARTGHQRVGFLLNFELLGGGLGGLVRDRLQRRAAEAGQVAEAERAAGEIARTDRAEMSCARHCLRRSCPRRQLARLLCEMSGKFEFHKQSPLKSEFLRIPLRVLRRALSFRVLRVGEFHAHRSTLRKAGHQINCRLKHGQPIDLVWRPAVGQAQLAIEASPAGVAASPAIVAVVVVVVRAWPDKFPKLAVSERKPVA